MDDEAAVRVPYEVRVGTALGPILSAALPGVRSVTTAVHATVVVAAAGPEGVVDALRGLLVPGVTLELLRVVVDRGVPSPPDRPAQLEMS